MVSPELMAGEEEGLFLAEFNLDEIRRDRRKTIHGNAYRRPHRYKLLISPEKDEVWRRIDGIGKQYDASKR